MKLIDDWKTVLWRSWAVRLSVISAVLSGAEFALPYLAPAKSSFGFALLAAAVSMGAAVSRIVAQPKLWAKLSSKHSDALATTIPGDLK